MDEGQQVVTIVKPVRFMVKVLYDQYDRSGENWIAYCDDKVCRAATRDKVIAAMEEKLGGSVA